MKTTSAERGHLSRRLLDDFFVGTCSVAELGAAVVGHLEEVCEGCHEELTATVTSYTEAFAAAEARGATVREAIERERTALPGLLAALLASSPTETAERVATDRRYATVAFVEHELAVAWESLEEGALDVVDQALELAWFAHRRLTTGRYGAPLVRRLEAEICLAWARRSAAKGDRRTARAYLLSAGRLLRRTGRPADLRGAEGLAAAEILLLDGRVERARRVLTATARRLRGAESLRWMLPVERMAARIERLEGAPTAAVERLSGLLGDEAPRERFEWSLARELVLALVAAGESDEAVATMVAWWGPPEDGRLGSRPDQDPAEWFRRGWRSRREDVPEAELLLGVILRSRGKVAAAEAALCSARDGFLRRERAADAVLATVELLRLHESQGDAEGLRLETSDLDRLAERSDAPRAALRELTRFAAAIWRGRVGELARVERALLLRIGQDNPRPPNAHGTSP